MPVHRSRRPAFTLVELIVVIAIIALLAALTATFFPNFQDTELVNRGADQLQNWLLSAKMQAKRDGLPTGIRLNLGTVTIFSNNTTVPGVTTVDYIQQPNNFAQGAYIGFIPTPPATTTPPFTAQIQLADLTTFNSMLSQTLPGDFLEVNGGGVTHRITNVRPPSPMPPNPPFILNLDLDPNTAPLPALNTPPTTITTTSVANYRIIPQPRVLNGEQTLSLPTNIAVSFETPNGSSLSLNVPLNNQILFAPSGAVVGQGTGTGQIILWVRNTSEPITSADLTVGKGTLITIQPRTGFIAAQAVAAPGSPYAFTTDGRSSGL